MSDRTIEPGVKGTGEVTVIADNTARSMGSGTLEVFATPAMALLVESVSSESVESLLEDGWTTVGTRMDLTHSAPSPVGSHIFCETELVEVDRRRLVFSFHVRDGSGEIGSGTHERFIVDSARFMDKASSRLRSHVEQLLQEHREEQTAAHHRAVGAELLREEPDEVR
ncbi:MAG: hypothetical protein IJ856_02685, partial [Candidatus Methanomethylophilaceae archaeon]|nr:hypothetical protein [Candidatus Methanomethylophilaceae archaeon]